jgi:hypothetical protein
MFIGVSHYLGIEELGIYPSLLLRVFLFAYLPEILCRQLTFSEPVITSTISTLVVIQVQVC